MSAWQKEWLHKWHIQVSKILLVLSLSDEQSKMSNVSINYNRGNNVVFQCETYAIDVHMNYLL